MNSKNAILDKAGILLATKQWSTGGESERLPLGADFLDQRLGGGLPRAALHEIFAEKPDNVASTSAFAMMLALCLTEINRPILWIMEEKVPRYSGQLYPLGMITLGANPDAMVVVETRDVKDALRASADAIRSAAVAAVILSVWGNAPVIDLTATRRLALAASHSGVLALLLRFDATPVTSAAHSRWQVASAPSRPLAANAPGFPAFDITLTRHRGGIPPFAARVEWNHEKRSFQDSPLYGGLSALVISGTAGASDRQSA